MKSKYYAFLHYVPVCCATQAWTDAKVEHAFSRTQVNNSGGFPSNPHNCDAINEASSKLKTAQIGFFVRGNLIFCRDILNTERLNDKTKHADNIKRMLSYEVLLTRALSSPPFIAAKPGWPAPVISQAAAPGAACPGPAKLLGIAQRTMYSLLASK